MTLINDLNSNRDIMQVLCDTVHRALSKQKLLCAVGTPQLLAQPEFKTITTVQPILNLLEEEDKLGQLLSPSNSKPITIKIGTENLDEKIHNCSLIQAEFSVDDEHLGTLAILGPTRMEYGRIVGMLNYMQAFLKEMHEKNN